MGRALGDRLLNRELEQLAQWARIPLRSAALTDVNQATEKPSHPLTRREVEIIRYLAQGLSAREVGEALTISHKTVEVHISHILKKLNSSSRAEAIAHAFDLDLIDKGHL